MKSIEALLLLFVRFNDINGVVFCILMLPLELISLLAIMFPIKVCVSDDSSPNIFDPDVSIVEAVINEDVK